MPNREQRREQARKERILNRTGEWWRDLDPRRVLKAPQESMAEAAKSFEQEEGYIPHGSVPNAVYITRDYRVLVYHSSAGPWGKMITLAIVRHDRKEIKENWSTLQHIKTAICGPESMGLEVYPQEKHLVDEANIRWLWVFGPQVHLPFGLHLSEQRKHGDTD